jgi:ABC-type multidrug transport system ATPase subunit
MDRTTGYSNPESSVAAAGLDREPVPVLAARDITLSVGSKTILFESSVRIERGRFVGLIGPSGCGKSTLMKILAGVSSPDCGFVSVTGVPEDCMSANPVGFVPQDDVVHSTLTVQENLSFAAELRLVGDAGSLQREASVQKVLFQLGLGQHSDTAIKDLSGGQRKRANLSVEMVTNPPFLLLDEPLSGLDPETCRKLMHMFRELTDAGHGMLVSTHTMEQIELFDTVVVMQKGRIVYEGPPSEMCDYFDVAVPERIFERMADRPSQEWEGLMKATNGLARKAKDSAEECAFRPRSAPKTRHGLLGVLTRRSLAVLVKDSRNLTLLLAQAPLITICIALAYDASSMGGRLEMVFKMSLAAIWFGCINSCREIVKERAIFERERLAGIPAGDYVFSKFIILAALCLVQSVIMVAVIRVARPFEADFGVLTGVLWLTSLTSLGLGLFISALVNKSDKALSILPIVLIPQAIFVGQPKARTGLVGAIESLMPSRWSFACVKQVVLEKDVQSCALELKMLVFFAVAFLFAAVCALKLANKWQSGEQS